MGGDMTLVICSKARSCKLSDCPFMWTYDTRHIDETNSCWRFYRAPLVEYSEEIYRKLPTDCEETKEEQRMEGFIHPDDWIDHIVQDVREAVPYNMEEGGDE